MVVHNEALCLQVFVCVLVCVDRVRIALEELLVPVKILLLVMDLHLLPSPIVASEQEALLVRVLLFNLLGHLIRPTHALTQSLADLARCLCLLRNECIADFLFDLHLKLPQQIFEVVGLLVEQLLLPLPV